MTFNVFQQTSPVAEGNVLVGAVYKNTARTMLLQSVIYSGPYTGQTQESTWTFSQNIAYYYICYESTDGTASGTIHNQFVIQPGTNTYGVRDILYLIVDGLTSGIPFASTGNFYGPDESLPTWNWYLEQVNYGTIDYGVDWVKTVAGVPTTIDDTTADGWMLLQTGALLASGAKYAIHFYPQLSTTITPQGTNLIQNTQVLTGSISLDQSAIGQCFLLQGNSTYLRVNLPDPSTIPDNEPIYFVSAGGSHYCAGIFATNATFQWYYNSTNINNGVLQNHIYLGQSENLTVYKYTNAANKAVWVVLSGGEAYRYVGDQVLSYNKQQINTVYLNGGLLSRTAFARLWEWVQTLESGALINDNLWQNTTTGGSPNNIQTYQSNYGLFTNGDGSTTFRVPLLSGYGFQRIVAISPGRFQIGRIETHNHATHAFGPIPGSGSNWYLSTGLNSAYGGGGSDQLGRTPVTGGPDYSMRTGTDNNGTNVIQTETIPNNFGIYAMIRS